MKKGRDEKVEKESKPPGTGPACAAGSTNTSCCFFRQQVLPGALYSLSAHSVQGTLHPPSHLGWAHLLPHPHSGPLQSVRHSL
jgi:hypothetical protein